MKFRHSILIPTADPRRYRIIRSTRRTPLTRDEVARIISKADRGIAQRGLARGGGMWEIVHRDWSKP